MSTKEVLESLQDMKQDFFRERLRPVPETETDAELKSRDPFQSEYFEQNLFEAHLRCLPRLSKTLRVANLRLSLESDAGELEITNDVCRDFRRLLASLRLSIIEVSSETPCKVRLDTGDRKELTQVLGSAFVFTLASLQLPNPRAALGPAGQSPYRLFPQIRH